MMIGVSGGLRKNSQDGGCSHASDTDGTARRCCCRTQFGQAVFVPRPRQGLLCAARVLLHLRRRRHALLLRAHTIGLHPTAVPPHVSMPAARVRPVPNGALGRLHGLQRKEAQRIRLQAQCGSQPLRHVRAKHARQHIFLRLLLELGMWTAVHGRRLFAFLSLRGGSRRVAVVVLSVKNVASDA